MGLHERHKGTLPAQGLPKDTREREGREVCSSNLKDLSRVGGEEEGWVIFIHCILSYSQRGEV